MEKPLKILLSRFGELKAGIPPALAAVGVTPEVVGQAASMAESWSSVCARESGAKARSLATVVQASVDKLAEGIQALPKLPEGEKAFLAMLEGKGQGRKKVKGQGGAISANTLVDWQKELESSVAKAQKVLAKPGPGLTGQHAELAELEKVVGTAKTTIAEVSLLSCQTESFAHNQPMEVVTPSSHW